MVIYLCSLPEAQTQRAAAHLCWPCSGGSCLAADIAAARWLLHSPFHPGRLRGGVTLALIRQVTPPGFPRRHALWSADFPRVPAHKAHTASIDQPGERIIQHAGCPRQTRPVDERAAGVMLTRHAVTTRAGSTWRLASRPRPGAGLPAPGAGRKGEGDAVGVVRRAWWRFAWPAESGGGRAVRGSRA